MEPSKTNLEEELLQLTSKMELSSQSKITLDTELTGLDSEIESIEYVQIIALFEDFFEEKGQPYDLFEISLKFTSFTIRALCQYIYQNQ